VRKADLVELAGGPGTLGVFESFEVSSSIAQPSEAKFVIGDDRAWKNLEKDILPGAEYSIRINKRTLFSGRVEANEIPGDAGGVKVSIILRTKLSDARYASADPAIKVSHTTIKDFILALFAQHGYTETDFYFSSSAGTDLLTGAPQGGKENPNLAAMTLQQAMVQPPETVLECATRHLQRHGLMMWDGPDGKICIGQPNDTAKPSYTLRSRRDGPGSIANNLLEWRRLKDWRDIASEISVYGQTDGTDGFKRPVKARVVDDEVDAIAQRAAKHFYRPIRFPAERAKNSLEAELAAHRELGVRRRRKDGWEMATDGWTYWDGTKAIPYSINAVANVEVDAAGGPRGPYLIWRVGYAMNVQAAQTCQLACIAPGLWDVGDAQ
jgi:prophage tail gpP-like protein